MTAMMVGGGAYGGVGGSMGRGGSLSPPSHRLPSPHSPHSPPSPVSSESPTSPNSLGRAKACGVCGDIAKSMHFGGLSCDSCKAFFRRSVQNNAHRGFTCPYEKKCVIAVSSRKSCQYCRFHKCLSIGMEKGWVMTEDERRKMMQQRQEKKTKEEQKKVNMTSVGDKYTLSEEDSTEISIIVSLYKKAYQDVPYQEESQEEGARSVMSPWMTFCKRVGYFFSLFREFADLPSSDQALLLKTAITSACIIMGSVVYDSKSGRWPGMAIKRTGFIPNVTSQNVQRLVPAELMSRVESFFKKFQQVCPDETMAMILILVALYSPELMGLEAKETIQALQDRYTRVLHKYVGWKYKEQSALMFPKVIVSLADIRELAERTCQMRIQQSLTTNIPTLSTLMSKPGPSSSSSGAGSPMDTNEGEDHHHEDEEEGAVGGMAGLSGHEDIGSGEGSLGEVQVKQECELQGDSALQTEAAHKRARLEATGGARDHTYQKIMQKIMDQMHGSSIHMRAPSLLPFIIQIVKKVGAGNTSGTTGPLEQPTPGPGHKPSRSHHSKHHHHHHHRSASKRRMVEVKQERVEDDLDLQDISSPLSSSTMSPGLHPSPPPPHFPQQLQMEPQSVPQHHHLPHSPSLPQQTHHFTSSPSHPPFTSPNYPASPMESTDSCDLLPTASPHDPLAMSPMHSTSPDMMPPLPGTHMIPVAPYTPPSASPSPSIPHKQPTVFTTADMPLPSPVAAPSPYSDTSSSSPESSQSPLYELFSEDLSNVEIDVLTQLLDYVSNFDNLENVSSLKEILPPHLLTELQTKLCSYSFKQE